RRDLASELIAWKLDDDKFNGSETHDWRKSPLRVSVIGARFSYFRLRRRHPVALNSRSRPATTRERPGRSSDWPCQSKVSLRGRRVLISNGRKRLSRAMGASVPHNTRMSARFPLTGSYNRAAANGWHNLRADLQGRVA